MNFEKGEMNKESLIRKVSKIGFFDSLSCNLHFWNFRKDKRFQVLINSDIL